MNPRIQKISGDIEKLRRKITDGQARLRELERQKLELENADIIAAVRSIDVPPEELSALIAKLQNQSAAHFEQEQEEQIFEDEN